MRAGSVPGETGRLQPEHAVALPQARKAAAEALAAGTSPYGLPAAQLMAGGSMTLFFYEPRGTDAQPPHGPDEVYVVMSGSGRFAIGDDEGALARISFGPGTALFAPAGAVHRFEDFTDDVGTWVIMYGPEGGKTVR